MRETRNGGGRRICSEMKSDRNSCAGTALLTCLDHVTVLTRSVPVVSLSTGRERREARSAPAFLRSRRTTTTHPSWDIWLPPISVLGIIATFCWKA